MGIALNSHLVVGRHCSNLSVTSVTPARFLFAAVAVARMKDRYVLQMFTHLFIFTVNYRSLLLRHSHWAGYKLFWRAGSWYTDSHAM